MPVSRPRARLLSLRVATVFVLLAIFSLLGLGQFLAARHTLASSLEASEQRDELLRARHVQALVFATVDDLKRLSKDEFKFVIKQYLQLYSVPLQVDVEYCCFPLCQ